jgi:hypothetical protein
MLLAGRRRPKVTRPFAGVKPSVEDSLNPAYWNTTLLWPMLERNSASDLQRAGTVIGTGDLAEIRVPKHCIGQRKPRMIEEVFCFHAES